jgi:hypothetical protein
MSRGAKQLAQARTARDESKASFDGQMEQLRGDLEVQSIGERIKQRLLHDARAGFYRAADVASESKGLIAGILVVLTLWFMRQPIIAWFKRQKAEGTDHDVSYHESGNESDHEGDDEADYHEVNSNE